MIVKTFEIKKKEINNFKFFLIYGNNSGLIDEIIENDLKPKLSKNIYNYDENEILQNDENFKDDILSKSFFDDEKLIIISRTTDKIFKLIEEIIDKNIKDIVIILKASTLEKKSKLRNLFEKNSGVICTPVYEDNNQSLSMIVENFEK